ncbi:MAG: site-2 protease family protein [bacterium]|nr:MAG: site-2 protease family protein [bacterium]
MPLLDKQVTIGRVRGISIVIDPSWFLIFILLSWVLSASYFPLQVPGLAPFAYWAAGTLAAAGLFLSVTLHELGHSLVAIRRGLPVKKIVLFVFGGVSQLEEEPEDAGTEMIMAIVGPLVSAALAGGLHLAKVAASAAGAAPLAVVFLGYLAFVNLILSVFNLLPGLPLDGGRLLRALMWKRGGDPLRATWVASEVGAGFGSALFIIGAFLVLMGNLAGLWYILIGFFLRNAAQASYQQMTYRSLLAGVKVEQIMTENPVTVDQDILLEEFVDQFLLAYHHPVFPVLAGDRVRGVAEAEAVKKVPRELWKTQTIERCYRPLSEVQVLSPSEDASEALKKMVETKSGRLLVMQGDRLVGILSRRDIMDYLNLKSSLFLG